MKEPSKYCKVCHKEKTRHYRPSIKKFESNYEMLQRATCGDPGCIKEYREKIVYYNRIERMIKQGKLAVTKNLQVIMPSNRDTPFYKFCMNEKRAKCFLNAGQ